MHYLSKSSRSEWKGSRKEYLERKRTSRRRSVMERLHPAKRPRGAVSRRRRSAAVKGENVRQQIRQSLRQIRPRDILTVLILAETVCWIGCGLYGRIRQTGLPALLRTGFLIAGMVLAAAFVLLGPRPGRERVRRRKRLLYLEYAIIALAAGFCLWRGAEQAGAAAFLPALIWGIDRIGAFLG